MKQKKFIQQWIAIKNLPSKAIKKRTENGTCCLKAENWSIYHQFNCYVYDGLFFSCLCCSRIFSQRIYTINIVMHSPEPSIISNMPAIYWIYMYSLQCMNVDNSGIICFMRKSFIIQWRQIFFAQTSTTVVSMDSCRKITITTTISIEWNEKCVKQAKKKPPWRYGAIQRLRYGS